MQAKKSSIVSSVGAKNNCHAYSRHFYRLLLAPMDSKPNTNRKGFLKRGALAVASVFAVSSSLRSTSTSEETQRLAKPLIGSRLRVRTAKEAVERKA